MDKVKVAIIGAGSRSFAPSMVRDIFLSDPINERGIDLRLMDIKAENMEDVRQYAEHLNGKLERDAEISATTDLDRALDGADHVIAAIDFERFLYWSQDFHIPRKHGFRQVFGENGGPGGIFHGLRNMGPTVEIAKKMEKYCPDAPLLNFSNPEHKLCEAVSRLTSIQAVGLCHGVFMGLHQIASILGMNADDLDTAACGINHFSWFTKIRDRKTGEDLYPKLREIERKGDWISDWHEIGLARILFRRFGLWPSPAANHYGEYIGWADEFVASELQFYYDPADGHPWETKNIPEFVYSLTCTDTRRPWIPSPQEPSKLEDSELRPSGELAVPIIESLSCGIKHHLAAINVQNNGAIPNLPDDMVVEIPADGDSNGLHPWKMDPLPEGIVAMLRLQGSIHKLMVEAFAEESKDKLIQAVLLDPTATSYRRAVEMVDEMISLQKDLLPEFV